MTIINPIQYVKSVYRASTHTKRIMPKGYVEGYFMKKSPLERTENLGNKENCFSKLFNKISRFFQRK